MADEGGNGMNVMRDGAAAAQRVLIPKVVGSNPTPAANLSGGVVGNTPVFDTGEREFDSRPDSHTGGNET